MSDDGFGKTLEPHEERVVTLPAGMDDKKLCRIMVRLLYVRRADARAVPAGAVGG